MIQRTTLGGPLPDPCYTLGCIFSILCANMFCPPQAKAWEDHPAHWIWPSLERHSRQVAVLHHHFELDAKASQVELHVVADFADARVFINGSELLPLENFGPAISKNISQHVKNGKNSIHILTRAADATPAVAVRIQITSSLQATRTILSDHHWQGTLVDIYDPALLNNLPPTSNVNIFGDVSSVFWSQPEADIAIDEFDNYEQWRHALGKSTEKTSLAKYFVADGFELELLREAHDDEGSWISMAFDPHGRLTVSREDAGLLRFSRQNQDSWQQAQVATINSSLLECRGLVYVGETLYANANNSKGLYRLQDTTADDYLDKVELVYASSGAVGHGRNDLTVGPDGQIYSIHGDDVNLPVDVTDRTSPLRHHTLAAQAGEGHVIRLNQQQDAAELLLSGLRNPYGIAFNADGEMFTYDADAEFDMGASWYRQTRVVHLVSGADYGWRAITGRWPPYFTDHADNGGYNINIGKGSPTAILFGTKSRFPEPYKSALFILDWAYGRILAVHMEARGASYVCRAESLVKGMPLNVTDLAMGPEGDLYFVTGGRGTQSALFRIRSIAKSTTRPFHSPQQVARREHAAQARTLRRALESLHHSQNQDTVARAWPHLNAADPWIRHAARIAIEHQPLEHWQEQVFLETQTQARLTALMMLSRTETAEHVGRILSALAQFPLAELSISQQSIALFCYTLCLQAIDPLSTEQIRTARQQLNAIYPGPSFEINRQTSQLLVKLGAADIISKTLRLLATTTNPLERFHCLYVLRNVREGWTLADRRQFFDTLDHVELYQGGQGMPGFLTTIRDEAIATLTDTEKTSLAISAEDLITEELPPLPKEKPRPFIQKWTTQDLIATKTTDDPDLENGKQLFTTALCSQCHRLGALGFPIGPDLTNVARRFSEPDLLESILAPSKVVAENYRNVRVVTRDGKVISGRVVPNRDYRLSVLRINTNSLDPHAIEIIPKLDIETFETIRTSPMPAGLLDSFAEKDIRDLIAFIRTPATR